MIEAVPSTVTFPVTGALEDVRDVRILEPVTVRLSVILTDPEILMDPVWIIDPEVIIPPVAVTDPVTIISPLEIIPFLATNSKLIIFLPRHCRRSNINIRMF